MFANVEPGDRVKVYTDVPSVDFTGTLITPYSDGVAVLEASNGKRITVRTTAVVAVVGL